MRSNREFLLLRMTCLYTKEGSRILKYAVRRILALIITMIMVSFLAFAAFHMISGDPAQAILGTNATPERLELLRHELGLDQPFLVQ